MKAADHGAIKIGDALLSEGTPLQNSYYKKLLFFVASTEYTKCCHNMLH